ncbi:MAG: acetylornithine deacetylase [Pseudomonadota bacterium]
MEKRESLMGKHYSSQEMLEKLVGFPTVSRDSNLDLIDFVRDYLDSHGVGSTTVPFEEGRKANLYASVGPNVEGGVVLSGHTDVVPVDGQDWTSDPFRLTERDDKLYGRGTCDMKGFSAINLALLPEMLKADLKKPIHFALSCDEEIGCLGAPAMIADMVDHVPKPRAVIVGEPTLYKVVTEQKGTMRFDTLVRGHSVHSSLCPQGVSAVTVAARLIAWLDDRMQDNAARAQPGSPFDPPYTTIHCGVVSGGTAPNIVAQDAMFICDIRTVTGERPEDHFAAFQRHVRTHVEPAMKAKVPETGISFSRTHTVPGIGGNPGGDAETLARQLTGDNELHGVAYGTEAGQFEEVGYSVVVCGPGSIEQAHQADEFIASDQLARGETFVRDLITHLS